MVGYPVTKELTPFNHSTIQLFPSRVHTGRENLAHSWRVRFPLDAVKHTGNHPDGNVIHLAEILELKTEVDGQ